MTIREELEQRELQFLSRMHARIADMQSVSIWRLLALTAPIFSVTATAFYIATPFDD